MAVTTPFSFQLYSARKFPPLADQLARLAAIGFTSVEPFGPIYDDVDGFGAALARNGLVARSGHFGLDMLEAEFAKALDIAGALRMDFMVAPYLVPELRPTDAAGWQALGRRLAAVAAKVKAAGLRFAWHNHDFEFVALADGSLPIEHLIGGDVLWEADLAWVSKAGVDPQPWLARYAGHVPLVHVKDVATAGTKADEDGWADVGAGVLPWASLWAAAVAAGAEVMVAEHDNPSDYGRFAAASFAAMSAFNARA